MTRLSDLRPMLGVRSLDETLAFWNDVLGFTTIATFGDDPATPTWAQVERDGVRVMFTWSEPHDHGDGDLHSHDPALHGSLYVDVDDVDALHTELEGRGAAFDWTPYDQPYGMRDMGVLDPNGFLVIFGSPVAEG